MLVTGNFSDFYGTTLLPGLRAVADRGYRKRPTFYTKLFQVNPSTRSIEQFSQVSGVGRFQSITQGGPVRRDMPVQGFRTTFVHERFGLSVPTTIDMVEDDKWQLIDTMHKDLGWSGHESRELQAAATFNNAFSGSHLGPDGVALVSASHPLYKAGGVQSNLLPAADLDMYSLQVGLTAYELLKRPSGEFIHAGKPRLVHAPANRFIAYALTKSADDPSTTNRSTNPLDGAEDGMVTAFTYTYLSSPNAWFLVAQPDETGLVWFDRRKTYTKSWTDDETETGVFAMRYKKSHGWNNYIGLMGNAGS